LVKPRRNDKKTGLRFALTGTFCSLNRGDCAMQLVVARFIRKRWPGAEVAIHTPHPETDREIYAGFEVIPCSRRKPFRALLQLARAALYRSGVKPSRLSAELASIRDSALVVDLSGDGLTETFGPRCPISHTIPLLYAALLGTPFCLLGQTIGPFGPLGRWILPIIGKAAFVTAREEESFNYLRRRNLRPPVRLTADLAFLLEPEKRKGAEQYLRKLGDFSPQKPLIGLTPSNLYNIRSVRRNVRSRSPGDLFEIVAKSVRKLARKIGGGVLIIPHVFGPGDRYDDRLAADRIFRTIGGEISVFVVRDALRPEDLKALIGLCDIFVGMRMHSLIGALSQGVPAIALAYGSKQLGLMRRFGMERFAFEMSDLREAVLGEALGRLWAEKTGLRGSIKSKMESEIVPASRENLTEVANLVESLYQFA